MSPPGERRLLIESSGGIQLEGALHRPPDAAFGAVVLHPHPQFGGDMENHVVRALCAAFAARGGATLRFNFRGTGASRGAYDGGRGEADDARAAVGALRASVPGVPVILAGYSFGAQVAALAAADLALAGLVLVSPPLAYAALPPLPAGLAVLALAGDADPVCPAEALRALAGLTCTVRVVAGAGHGWEGGLDGLAAELALFDPQIGD